MISRQLAFSAMLIASGLAAGATAQGAPDPCRVVRMACLKAGFKPGTGPAGLERACLKPIAYGTNPPKGATMALPSVDPKVADACRASLEGKVAVTSPASKPTSAPTNEETPPAASSRLPTAVSPHNPPPTDPGPGQPSNPSR